MAKEEVQGAAALSIFEKLLFSKHESNRCRCTSN